MNLWLKPSFSNATLVLYIYIYNIRVIWRKEKMDEINLFCLYFCYSEITRQHTGGELPLPRLWLVSWFETIKYHWKKEKKLFLTIYTYI